MAERPSETELLARARAMVPMLAARAAETEKLRRLPDETNRAFRDAGFYKAMQPRRFGGYEMDFGIQTELGVALGRGCGSSSWVATLTCCHAWLAGMFPPAAQEEIWGKDADTTVSTSFLPVAPKAERAAGGLRVSGRWKFSSGVQHCRWIVLVLPAGSEAGGAPNMYFALVPLSDCRIEDTWHAVGLAGTGSNDVVVENALVPPHRLLDMATLKGGPTPGSAVNDHYLYRLPLLAPFAFNIVGNAIGVARGVVETIVAGLKEQRNLTGVPVAANQSVQLRVAESLAEIEAAHAFVCRTRDEIVRRGRSGEAFPLADRASYRRDAGFAGQLCLRAVERVFPILGARGLMSDHPVQRGWRDLRAISQHVAMTWDIQGSLYGAVVLGQPCPNPLI